LEKTFGGCPRRRVKCPVMRWTLVSGFARMLLNFTVYGLLGAFVTALVAYILVLESRPDLSVWHLADLDEEFTTKSDISDFNQYLALEERLFAQLDELVYEKVPQGPENAINRYSRGSITDAGSWPVNWNRSFVLPTEDPAVGVVLLHGLSDSPYSMRALGEKLHKSGAWVLGLRIPGHGTAPSGLVEIRWQDMAAAVQLATRHVKESIGAKPLYLVGYSNGGALSVDYALSTLSDPSLPAPAGVVLLSPEIGVTAAAAFAVWQGRLGHLLGLDKLAWNSVLPEYDPYKYGSFAVNAGDLAHRITTHIQDQLDGLQGTGKLGNMPPLLAFQSSVDATVSPSALVENLFARLPSANHELVLFDINREVGTATLIKQDPRTVFRPMLEKLDRHFDLTVITNDRENSQRVVARKWVRGKEDYLEPDYLNDWPSDVFSLSHVALPFSPDDPIYGTSAASAGSVIHLGSIALRGEHGVLQVSGTDLLRLRWNPFFGYVQSRILNFMELSDP
jgi:alpha-beta hydrolase superfamily lysophospholipase